MTSSDPAASHDPTGVDLATQIARRIASIPGRSEPRRRYRRWDEEPSYSTSGPDDRDPQPLGAVLDQVISGRGWSKQIRLRQLLTQWSRLVGAVNAQHSRPEAFIDGVLVIRTDSTAWATALRRFAPALLANLNEELGHGSVRRIEVKGPDAPSWNHGPRSVRDGRGPRDTYG